ncbi:microsomal signal peptidase 12 kDa subunit [Plasmodium ovale wallikeri]|uniref:Signal peptidase complex subunit 1 n=2 Tax=Plasmodium ovale TaxID=36330 RepID=A0A1A8ZNI2_PLAOA|nr:microsomal signal peptidase 12 kDa subunit [Plasmodium ovale wallikeri]SBT45421.1 microsomal signal peptidase 12 kDa subunit [Plasmodium ovale wallikeri]SBT78749.1 microsomal signal peptidase 12 kDa subunit, putative [Plasmodium ovale]
MGLFSSIRDAMFNTYTCLKKNQMDFHGQKLAYLIKNVIFTISTIISIVVGYHMQDLSLSAYIILAGTALSAILVLPTWPIYNKHNIQWESSEESLKSKKNK